jgi:hypothetical protein
MTQKEKFENYFLDSAYFNMYMEDEAVYSRKEIKNRYRYTLKALTDK